MGNNNNYVECYNCNYKWDCERTYLGGCTDGKEIDEEESNNER